MSKHEGASFARRIIDATRQTLYEAFTQRDVLREWWAPGDYSIVSVEDSTLPQGGDRYTMVNGTDASEKYVWSIVYIETNSLDEVRWIAYQEEGFGEAHETPVCVHFEDAEDGVEVTVTQEGFPDQETADQHVEGWTACLEQLSELLLARG